MNEDEQKRIFSANLNRYISLSGKLQKEIAKDLGYSPTTFNTWCVGKIIPSAGKIQKIADYFHIGKSDLLDDKSKVEDYIITQSEYEYIKKYRAIDDAGKKVVDTILDREYNLLIESQKFDSEAQKKRLTEYSKQITQQNDEYRQKHQ